MLTGRQTLDNLNTGLNSVKDELKRVDAELQQLNQALTDNKQQQARTIQRLAEVRLDEIKRGILVADLDNADREVLAILQQRDEKLKNLEVAIEEKEALIARYEQDRNTYVDQVEEAGQRLIDAEHLVQSQLEKDEGYQAQLEKARTADSIADEAEHKAEQAEVDKIKKGKPFEDDALFFYLWKRQYGTTDYRANPLTRFLDNWVAKLCDYHKARTTYWTLLEIPARLQEHANNVRNVSDSELTSLEAIEKQFAANMQVPQFQKELETSEHELAGHDNRIAEMEDGSNTLIEQRTAFLSGEDEYSQSCLNVLSAAMEGADIYDLKEIVHLTRSQEDDGLVRDLEEMQVEYKDLRRDLAESRRRHDKQLNRLKELEKVRRQFKQHRFDDMRSGFSNEALIVSVLSQFLSGVMSGNDLWGTIRRNQRHRDVGAWPDFGSGGLGKASRKRGGGVWHRPGRSGGGGFRLPRNGGFSSRGRGGGFRTGGGF